MSRPVRMPNGMIHRKAKHTEVEVREIRAKLKDSTDEDARLLYASIEGLPDDELVTIETARADRLLPQPAKPEGKKEPAKADAPKPA